VVLSSSPLLPLSFALPAPLAAAPSTHNSQPATIFPHQSDRSHLRVFLKTRLRPRCDCVLGHFLYCPYHLPGCKLSIGSEKEKKGNKNSAVRLDGSRTKPAAAAGSKRFAQSQGLHERPRCHHSVCQLQGWATCLASARVASHFSTLWSSSPYMTGRSQASRQNVKVKQLGSE